MRCANLPVALAVILSGACAGQHREFRADQYVANVRSSLGNCDPGYTGPNGAGTEGEHTHRDREREYDAVFPGQRDCVLSADGIADPAASFAVPAYGGALYQGLEAEVIIHLRDHAQRPVRCHASVPLTVDASPPAIGGTASCQDEGYGVHFCFVALEPRVTFNVAIAGVALANSPFTLELLPTFMARAGCARPGVSSLMSACMPRLGDFMATLKQGASSRTSGKDPPIETIDDDEAVWSGAPAAARSAAGSQEGGDEGSWSQLVSVARNVFHLENACIADKSIVLFAHDQRFPLPFQSEQAHTHEHDDQRAEEAPGHGSGLVLGAHAWGQWKERALQIPLKILPHALHQFRAAASEADTSAEEGRGGIRGTVGLGSPDEILYVFPEGPTTHFGHMLMDLVVPMFVTMQLVSDVRDRKSVVLWPWSAFRCAAKGQRVHSRRFWDLFRGVTSHPHEDVVLLSTLVAQSASGTPLCKRSIVVGQALDMRVGYWYSPTYKPRTVPFLEDWPDAIAALVRAAAPLQAEEARKRGHEDEGTTQMPGWALLGDEIQREGGRIQREGDRMEPAIQATLIRRQESRRILNEEALIRELERAGFRVVAVDWAGMSVRRQIQTMQATSLLIGVHGTGLNNIAFARQVCWGWVGGWVDGWVVCVCEAQQHCVLSPGDGALRHFDAMHSKCLGFLGDLTPPPSLPPFLSLSLPPTPFSPLSSSFLSLPLSQTHRGRCLSTFCRIAWQTPRISGRYLRQCACGTTHGATLPPRARRAAIPAAGFQVGASGCVYVRTFVRLCVRVCVCARARACSRLVPPAVCMCARSFVVVCVCVCACVCARARVRACSRLVLPGWEMPCSEKEGQSKKRAGTRLQQDGGP